MSVWTSSILLQDVECLPAREAATWPGESGTAEAQLCEVEESGSSVERCGWGSVVYEVFDFSSDFLW